MALLIRLQLECSISRLSAYKSIRSVVYTNKVKLISSSERQLCYAVHDYCCVAYVPWYDFTKVCTQIWLERTNNEVIRMSMLMPIVTSLKTSIMTPMTTMMMMMTSSMMMMMMMVIIDYTHHYPISSSPITAMHRRVSDTAFIRQR